MTNSDPKRDKNEVTPPLDLRFQAEQLRHSIDAFNIFDDLDSYSLDHGFDSNLDMVERLSVFADVYERLVDGISSDQISAELQNKVLLQLKDELNKILLDIANLESERERRLELSNLRTAIYGVHSSLSSRLISDIVVPDELQGQWNEMVVSAEVVAQPSNGERISFDFPESFSKMTVMDCYERGGKELLNALQAVVGSIVNTATDEDGRVNAEVNSWIAEMSAAHQSGKNFAEQALTFERPLLHLYHSKYSLPHQVEGRVELQVALNQLVNKKDSVRFKRFIKDAELVLDELRLSDKILKTQELLISLRASKKAVLDVLSIDENKSLEPLLDKIIQKLEGMMREHARAQVEDDEFEHVISLRSPVSPDASAVATRPISSSSSARPSRHMGQLPKVAAAVLATFPGNIAQDSVSSPTDLVESATEQVVDSVREFVGMNDEQRLESGYVKAGDGVSDVLMRVVMANPEAYQLPANCTEHKVKEFISSLEVIKNLYQDKVWLNELTWSAISRSTLGFDLEYNVDNPKESRLIPYSLTDGEIDWPTFLSDYTMQAPR